MQYLFHTAIPIPWLLADILTLLITLVVVSSVIAKSKHPVPLLLEGFGFVFLYAGLFENFAVVNGWYVYGRSLLMIGDVPLSVPLIELDVLIVGLLGLIFCLGRSRPLQAGQEPFSLGV
jgi:uncharacterized membrane protein